MGNAKLPRAAKAEAAAWLARLHSENRTSADEAGFRCWLAEDPHHSRAFELVTTAWETAGGLASDPPHENERTRAMTRRSVLLSAVAASFAAGGVALWQLTRAETYTTTVGGKRRVALADGSIALLDTDTLIRVAFTQERRQIELVRGRAHFDVAPAPKRPFVVRAGEQQVIAIGTAFDVSRYDGAVAVVLVEGRVAVQPLGSSSKTATIMLAPGERIVFAPALLETPDHPNLAQVTAWHEGRAVFDDDPLTTAIAEMNRYSRRTLIVADPALGAAHVSGVFRTADTEAFARSVATLLSTSVEFTATQIIFGTPPSPADEISG